MKRKFVKKNKYQNPFLPQRNKLDINKSKRKKRIFLIIIMIIILLSLGYFFIYANLWKIKKVSVSGTKNSELINDIREIVQQNKNGFYGWLIPKDNILFFNLENLKNEINSQLVLDRLEIKKKIFGTLEIVLTEKLPVLIWNEGDDYYYIDKFGTVMGARRFEELEFDLPFINHGTTTQIIVGKKILTETSIKYAKDVLAMLANNLKDINVVQLVIPNMNLNNLYFYTEQGWYFILNTDNDIITSLDNLKRLINQKIKNINNLEYIDLRIEDKIFYKNYK